MKKLIVSLIRRFVPSNILYFLFPKKFISYNRFIEIEDKIAKRTFQMYLRKDSFIEEVILTKGLYGQWEKESLKIWAELSAISSVIIDIGANTGIYSLLAQNNNMNAKIVAIEPVNINYKILQDNINQNKFPIVAEKLAISNKNGTAKMFMQKDTVNYMTSVNDNRYAASDLVKANMVVEIDVKIEVFSYIVEKHRLNSMDLIKIDVEGHEIEVISSMLPYLKEYKPSILVEIIGDDNAIIINSMLREMDYFFISIDETNKSIVVPHLWDNDHHNFLICDEKVLHLLTSKGLVN